MLPKKRITTHPGEILQTEFLDPLGITQSDLARHIGLMPYVICELVNGKRGVSPAYGDPARAGAGHIPGVLDRLAVGL